MTDIPAAPPPSAGQVIDALGLAAHPEGGHFKEIYRHQPADGSRGAMTSIYYLLQAGEVSAWHRVRDADEIWHFHAGAPLELSLSLDGSSESTHVLGQDVINGQRPQVLIPAGGWQSARSLGAWTLVGCTVAPAFDFNAFEMAPDGWHPG